MMADKTKKPIVTVRDVDEADALEIALTKWRIGVCAGTNGTASKQVLARIKQRGGINPKALKRAAELFKDVIETTDDWWTLYLTCKFAAIKDDARALGGFDTALANGWGTGRVKEYIADANGHSAAHKPSHAEQIINIIDKYSSTAVKAKYTAAYDALNDITDELAALPAVRRALAKREAK